MLARRRDVDWRGKVVLHASGALTSDELKALKKRGAAIASTHFMQSFVPGSNPSLAVPFAVEGDKAATSTALKIGQALGAKPFLIRKQSKVLYHAMGFFSSPLVIIALSLSEKVGRQAGLNTKQIEVSDPPHVLPHSGKLFEEGKRWRIRWPYQSRQPCHGEKAFAGSEEDS